MDDHTFQQYAALIYAHSGINLGDNKKELLQARVAKRMRSLKIPDYREYYNYVLKDNSGEELAALLDAISTNVTSFFREKDHFDFLSTTVKDWHTEGQRRFRFWSAACSTGEEPFSLAMTILETMPGEKYIDTKILATDISRPALQVAKEGIYERKKMEHFPVPGSKYFESIGQDRFMARNFLRNMVVFNYLNLQGEDYPFRGPMDAIFCRNVMIYFDEKGRSNIINRFYNLLRKGGYLFVGHSESLLGMTNGFQYIRPSIYQKP